MAVDSATQRLASAAPPPTGHTEWTPRRIQGELDLPQPDHNEVCFCNSCGTWLVFQASRKDELVNCPYCLLATVLYLPEVLYSYSPEKTNLEIYRLGWGVTRMGYRCVTGKVMNHGKNHLDWLRIQFQLYDSTEEVVATTSDSSAEIAPGGVWSFQAPVTDARVLRASMPVLSTEHGKIKLVERFSAVPADARQNNGSKPQPLPVANLEALRRSQALERARLVAETELVRRDR